MQSSMTEIKELKTESDRLVLEIESLKSINQIYKKNAEIATQERLQALKEAADERLKSQQQLQELESRLQSTIDTLTAKNAEYAAKIERLTAQVKEATQK